MKQTKQKLTKKEIKRAIKLAKSEVKQWQLFLKRMSKLLIIMMMIYI